MKRALSTIVIAILILVVGCAPASSPGVPEGAAPAAQPVGQAPPSVGEPAAPSKYNEAPMLAELVAKGELPPVEERLPEEPLVVTPFDEIGKYGGEYRGAAFGPTIGQLDTHALRRQNLLQIELDLATQTPSILKDFLVSEDYRVYTLILRKGMKWSDGHPFIADDFMFWYEDILKNDELYPAKPVHYAPDDRLIVMTKVDDVTIEIEFEEPNMSFDLILARSDIYDRMFAPKHYLQQFHIRHNEAANELAKQEGFETWVQLFQYHSEHEQPQQDTALPGVTPWILTNVDELGNKYFDRNPYYWKVDTAGNQLPYIDRQVAVIVRDAEVRTLMLINGELDAAGENPLPVSDFTLYKESEEKGDYKVYLFDNTRGNDVGFRFNLTSEDLVLRGIFQDIRFRQAASLAINRAEINEVLYFGRAAVRNATIPPSVSFYEDWMGDYFAEYDPDRANALLDEMGLVWDEAAQVRMRPDGKPLEIAFECWTEFCPHSELVAEMWTAVGIKTLMKQEERSLWLERESANQHEAAAYPYDSVAEPNLRAQHGARLRPSSGTGQYARLWYDWFTSGGTLGEEPPEDVLALEELCRAFGAAVPGSDEYMQLGNEMATVYTERLYNLGVSLAPRVIIISNKLGNTPTEGTFANDYGFWDPFQGDQWYVK